MEDRRWRLAARLPLTASQAAEAARDRADKLASVARSLGTEGAYRMAIEAEQDAFDLEVSAGNR